MFQIDSKRKTFPRHPSLIEFSLHSTKVALLAVEKTRWAREPKSKTAHNTPFLKNLVV